MGWAHSHHDTTHPQPPPGRAEPSGAPELVPSPCCPHACVQGASARLKALLGPLHISCPGSPGAAPGWLEMDPTSGNREHQVPETCTPTAQATSLKESRSIFPIGELLTWKSFGHEWLLEVWSSSCFGLRRLLGWKIYNVSERQGYPSWDRTLTSWALSSSFHSRNPSWFITVCPSHWCNEI